MSVDWTKPIRTIGGGKPLRLLGTINNGSSYVVVVNESYEWVYAVSPEGISSSASYNVENVPVEPTKRKGWINVYPNGDTADCLRPAKRHADDSALPQRMACIEVEYSFVPGQGLPEAK